MERFRKLGTAFWVRLVAYEDAVRRAIQAYNEYVRLRHQSETNLRRQDLRREDVSSAIFRKYYRAPTSADTSPLSGVGPG